MYLFEINYPKPSLKKSNYYKIKIIPVRYK